jgi:hypothetical protein
MVCEAGVGTANFWMQLDRNSLNYLLIPRPLYDVFLAILKTVNTLVWSQVETRRWRNLRPCELAGQMSRSTIDINAVPHCAWLLSEPYRKSQSAIKMAFSGK